MPRTSARDTRSPATGADPHLIVEPNIADPDATYRMIVEAHRGLSPEQSAALDSALVLSLANHIGHKTVIAQALALARKALATNDPR